ncbi:semaphorin-6C-like [Anneissia japonica]|uniref:semaphorin-6C-like n=1 Tax=Anneissia japonica TaxID=1529436 RepID=UPI0014256566|nr:semaphorin-6C-like [Anneissia japonica]
MTVGRVSGNEIGVDTGLDVDGNVQSKGKEEEDCQNYIKVITPDATTGNLLVCGTYAQKPRCVILNGKEVDTWNLANRWKTNATDALYKCPFGVDQKVTTVFADGSLYAGTVADFSGRGSAFTRSMGGGYLPLISKKSDSIWLNDPVFVGSYQEDNEVYLFFREMSIETQFTEKMHYSRITAVSI